MNEPIAARIDIGGILDPRSVAVFGASDNTDKFGGRIIYYLTRHGFPGHVLPINPNRDTVRGLPAYPSIAAAPGPVDVAILAVPPQALLDAVAECAAAGVGACVIMTTGFAETGDAAGAERQRRLVEIARASGMRIVGPNCMGLIAPRAHMALTSSLVLEIEAIRQGRVGLISQSGALMVSIFNRAHDAGIGFSACVSLGNQSDLEICDVLDWMIDDPGTDIICLYVEGLVDGARFFRAAARAREVGKPLLMVKTGRTEAGVRAARSHTASLAGSYRVFAAACRSLGVLLTDDPDGMVRAADLIRRWPRPPGAGIGVLSPSGGGSGIGVDRVSEAGLRVAELCAATKGKLLQVLLPPQADNPIDLGGRRSGDSVGVAGQCAAIMAGDPDVGIMFIVLTTVPFYEATTKALAEAALASGKPVVVAVTPGSAADGPRRVLREVGCPYFDTVDDGLRALRLLTARHESLALPPAAERPAGPAPAGPPPAAGRLTEPEAKALAARYGVPVTRETLAASADAAVAAAAAIGYPVVLKGVARALVHKSDMGVVRLGLADAAAVRRAFGAVEAILRGDLSVGAFEGCLVQEMARGEAEVILGIRRDPQFGPVVLAGMGGVLVEIADDIEVAPAPLSRAAARAMLGRLRFWPVLAGVRGRPPLDVDALVDAIVALGWLAVDLGDRLVDLEMNPVFVRAAGKGIVAVDARGEIAG
ncbi:MAG: acetate--CoA ligase family protein [Alphaproteobacteria bacterium]|nr:acetate--CoA ligase family protein [Alphaproteobacteria bacterium]